MHILWYVFLLSSSFVHASHILCNFAFRVCLRRDLCHFCLELNNYYDAPLLAACLKVGMCQQTPLPRGFLAEHAQLSAVFFMRSYSWSYTAHVWGTWANKNCQDLLHSSKLRAPEYESTANTLIPYQHIGWQNPQQLPVVLMRFKPILFNLSLCTQSHDI